MLAAATLFMYSCGGGGGAGGPGGGDTVTLGGIAATGAALANAAVAIKDCNGKKATGTTDVYGKFAVGISGLEAPFIIRVEKAGVVLVSYATGTENVNATALTTQVMSFAFGRDLAALPIDEITMPTVEQITAMETFAGKYISMLRAVCASDPGLTDLLQDFNLFTSTFNASGTGFDMILDLVDVAVSDFSDTGLTVTVGGESVLVDTSIPGAVDFTAIQSAMATAAEAQKAAKGKKVFFLVDDAENSTNSGMYSMWTDGTGLKQITQTLPSAYELCVFQDASAYFMIASGTPEDPAIAGNVYKYSATDGSLANLVAVIQRCEGLSFSHDGNTLAALLADENDDLSLYFLTKSEDGTSLVSTKLPGGGLEPLGWSWEPGNASLIIAGITEASEDSYTSDIFRITASSKTKLTNSPDIIKGYPAVSYDGRKIAYLVHAGDSAETSSSEEGESGSEPEISLHVGDLGTSSITGLARIVDAAMIPDSPVWTPEGKILFLGTDTDEKQYLYSINPNGTGMKKLTAMGTVRMIAVQP